MTKILNKGLRPRSSRMKIAQQNENHSTNNHDTQGFTCDKIRQITKCSLHWPIMQFPYFCSRPQTRVCELRLHEHTPAHEHAHVCMHTSITSQLSSAHHANTNNTPTTYTHCITHTQHSHKQQANKINRQTGRGAGRQAGRQADRDRQTDKVPLTLRC